MFYIIAPAGRKGRGRLRHVGLGLLKGGRQFSLSCIGGGGGVSHYDAQGGRQKGTGGKKVTKN